MSLYYLMAQLPSLDAIGEGTPLPITEARFSELCGRLLGKNAREVLCALTLIPHSEDAPSGVPIVDAWNRAEIELRTALAHVRAEKRGKPKPSSGPLPSVEVIQAAKTAADMTDPMEAERYLSKYRLEVLETLRPLDAFSLAAVYYYGLKLKLLTRIKGFDAAKGAAEYKTVYHSIVHGESGEMID